MTEIEIPCSPLLPVWKPFCSLIFGRKLLPLAPTISSFAKQHGFSRRKAKALINALIHVGLVSRSNGRITLTDPNLDRITITLTD
jgi:hypothetical protein